jgi:hypothetical protein
MSFAITLAPRKEGKRCTKMTTVFINPYLCTTFKSHLLVANPPSGTIKIDRLNFGSRELCSDTKFKRTTLFCDFERDSCGIRTDFCSLGDWTIQEEGSNNSRRNNEGLPLLKNSVSGNSCDYPICIPCFQYSGIDVTQVSRERSGRSLQIGKLGRRSAQGRSIYIDPRNKIHGPEVLNLPEVWHHPDNHYLHIYYDMVEGGLHVVTVRARCTASATNYIIALSESNTEYEVTNYEKENKFGSCCVDIHHYIQRDDCEAFTIQLIARAAYTPMLVDNIHFSSGLSWKCNGIVHNMSTE